jgi:hypothetical protein
VVVVGRLELLEVEDPEDTDSNPAADSKFRQIMVVAPPVSSSTTLNSVCGSGAFNHCSASSVETIAISAS